jgi:multicomponent Na+:H+ antiporter subunit D
MLFLSSRVRGALIGGVFALGALSVAGVPPAAGFIGKLELGLAVAPDPALLALLVAGSVLSLLYVFRIYQLEFWRSRETSGGRFIDQAVPLALATLVLAIGIWPEPLLVASQAAAQVLTSAP